MRQRMRDRRLKDAPSLLPRCHLPLLLLLLLRLLPLLLLLRVLLPVLVVLLLLLVPCQLHLLLGRCRPRLCHAPA